MYDYTEELRKTTAVIDKLIERVHTGVIVIPQEELSDDETPSEWIIKWLYETIDLSRRLNIGT